MYKSVKRSNWLKRFGIALTISCLPAVASAEMIYNQWATNSGASGSYILTVNEVNGGLNFNLNVDPWDAEALGLFVDLGDLDLPGAPQLSGVNPAGQVSVFNTDTSSNNCGPGCNLNGLNPSLPGDGEWELVFRLGSQGFNGIQSFSFAVDVAGLALSESMLGTVGIRAQQLCPAGQTLPTGSCGGSDKSVGTPGPTTVTDVVAPAPLALIGLGLGLAGLVGRWKNRDKV